MKLTTGQKGIVLIGDNMKGRYDFDFIEKSKSFLQVVLPTNMTSQEILKTHGVITTQAIFFVTDKEQLVRRVFCFWSKGGWNIVSPSEEEVPFWYKGHTLFTPLTL